MHAVIPFTGQVETEEQNTWIEAINTRSQLCRITPIDQLSENDKLAAEMAIVANPDPATLKQLQNLKWIQSLWAGVETIFASDIDSDIKVVRLTDPQLAESMAEAVLAWSLYLHRKMPQYRSQQNECRWNPLSLQLPEDCNISVFGLGKLGAKAVARLKLNGFTVRGWSRGEKAIDQVETFHGNSGLHQILPLTDVAVVLLPLTAQTENLFDATLLKQLPKGASVINFARGRIIVDSDLLAALDNDHIDHAVLDVFVQEPLPHDHAFWTHEKTTVLPHISAPTTIATAAAIAAGNIDRYITSGVIPDAADRSTGY